MFKPSAKLAIELRKKRRIVKFSNIIRYAELYALARTTILGVKPQLNVSKLEENTGKVFI